MLVILYIGSGEMHLFMLTIQRPKVIQYTPTTHIQLSAVSCIRRIHCGQQYVYRDPYKYQYSIAFTSQRWAPTLATTVHRIAIRCACLACAGHDVLKRAYHWAWGHEKDTSHLSHQP